MLPLTSERQSRRKGKGIERYNKNLVGKQTNLPVQSIAYFFISHVLRHHYAVLCPRQGWNFTLNVPKEILGKSLLLSEK